MLAPPPLKFKRRDGGGMKMISEMRLYAALGSRIRELRESEDGRKRMTQAELAQQVGLERTSITNIEKGSQKVPLHVLYRLCEVLKVDVLSVLPKLSDVQEMDRTWREVGMGDARLPPLAAQVLEAIVASSTTNEGKHEIK